MLEPESQGMDRLGVVPNNVSGISWFFGRIAMLSYAVLIQCMYPFVENELESSLARKVDCCVTQVTGSQCKPPHVD